MSRSNVAQDVLTALEDHDLDPEDLGDDRWLVVLSGEWKRTIPVLIEVDERHVRVSSLFAAAPDEGHRDVYEILLHRNARPSRRSRWRPFGLVGLMDDRPAPDCEASPRQRPGT